MCVCLFLTHAASPVCRHILSQEPRLMEKLLWGTVIIMAEEEEKLKYMSAFKVPIWKGSIPLLLSFHYPKKVTCPHPTSQSYHIPGTENGVRIFFERTDEHRRGGMKLSLTCSVENVLRIGGWRVGVQMQEGGVLA